MRVYNGDNYPGFPIVPMYANDLHESELEGIRESIDCYDFIKSNFANELDDSSGFYWTFKNAGGMDDKCGDFEYCIIDAIQKLLALIGVKDNPTFKWNRIANQTEETQMILTAANYLDDETVLKHLPWITPEEANELLKRRDAEGLGRFSAQTQSESA